MNPFKPGDIVKQQVAGTGGRFDYFHVEHAHPNGAIDAIDDSDGRPCGLSANHSRLQLASLEELMADRARRAGA